MKVRVIPPTANELVYGRGNCYATNIMRSQMNLDSRDTSYFGASLHREDDGAREFMAQLSGEKDTIGPFSTLKL